jgi:Xaa-Pro aminopeptidase
MPANLESLSDHALTQFRAVQRLAYDVVQEVSRTLEPGVTERQAAARVGDLLREQGIRQYFHRPFAWFGDRARFAGFRTPLAFFPTDRRLEQGMVGILDVAPNRDGYSADIGYTFAMGPSPELDAAMGVLAQLRPRILSGVLAERPLREIYEDVDEVLNDHGYVNCHQRYPFGVLAHRLEHTDVPAFSRPSLFGFGLGIGLRLLGQAGVAALPRFGGVSPFWNRSVSQEARATPGLWAVEPHIGRGELGAKWEEMMVVTPTTAHWLDDEVPHVQRWPAPSMVRVANAGA